MELKHSCGVYGSGRHEGSGNVKPPVSKPILAAISASILAAATLSACTSGGGGDNGNNTVAPDDTQGLNFTFPYNGQQDVTLNTQISLTFPGKLSGDVGDALSVHMDSANGPVAEGVKIVPDEDQDGIVRITHEMPLAPKTTYYVVTDDTLKAGASHFNAGDTLFQFTTRSMSGRPSKGDFRVTEASPGDTNPVTGRTTVFTQFNTIHIAFSEAVDPSTVVDGSTFHFTDSSGQEIPGRLTVSGHELTFDPTDDLPAGNYTLALTDDVTSAFGKSLNSFSVDRHVLSAGKTVEQNTTISPSSDTASDLPDNTLNGKPINLVDIATQLIGHNLQPARNSPQRQGVLTTLAQPGMPGFDDVIPATIRAGQKFELTPLSLKLNGKVPTPIVSGPIQVEFSSDANVYLQSNDLRNVITPTSIRLRFDLGIGTLVGGSPGSPENIISTLANGVFNQTALNIQGAGIAIPQDNGDLRISALVTFPIRVNRTDPAIVNAELTLLLPASKQTPVKPDTTAPFITAQYPSACLYAFGSPAYDAFYDQAAPTALPESACAGPLNGNPPPAGGLGVAANNYPIESSPALVFSEPMDPLSVNGNSVQLTSSSGDVSASLRVDGTAVIIDPDELLEPDTEYTINIGSGSALRDLSGNDLVANTAGGPGNTIKFTTEPQVTANPAPVLLGELSPGVPCALNSNGDFSSGGDNAGQCMGDADNGTTRDFAVFKSPANVPVSASLSKFVERDSVVLADGCLTSGSGSRNTVSNATVALEQVDSSGQCVGVPQASLVFPNRDGDKVRAFSIRPVGNLDVGSRYWIVVCGNDGSTCTSTITDIDGLALNTNPLMGSGSTNNGGNGAGGPDIVMPFDVTDASLDYYASQFTLPYSDTNGNGQFDDPNGDGMYTAGGTDERPQPGNRTLVNLKLLGLQIKNSNRDDGAYPSYLSLTRPIAIRKTIESCGAITNSIVDDDGNSVVGDGTADPCIQVSLLPGGMSALTGIGIGLGEALTPITNAVVVPLQNATSSGTLLGNIPILGPVLNGVFDTAGAALNGVFEAIDGLTDLPPVGGDGTASSGDLINTGRILLRFPDLADNGGNDTGTQSGYIVPKCQGSLNGTEYDYEPCFVASLNLVANAPDGQGVSLEQQTIQANIVGPVTFEQNGRLVISVRNANSFSLSAKALGLLPATADVNPGGLTFQLVGNATQGGRAYPQN